MARLSVRFTPDASTSSTTAAPSARACSSVSPALLAVEPAGLGLAGVWGAQALLMAGRAATLGARYMSPEGPLPPAAITAGTAAPLGLGVGSSVGEGSDDGSGDGASDSNGSSGSGLEGAGEGGEGALMGGRGRCGHVSDADASSERGEGSARGDMLHGEEEEEEEENEVAGGGSPGEMPGSLRREWAESVAAAECL